MYFVQEPFNKATRVVGKTGIEQSCEIYTCFNQLRVKAGIFDYGGGNATPSWFSIEDIMGCFPVRIRIENTGKEFEIDLHDGVSFEVYGDAEARGLASALRFIAETLEIKTGKKIRANPNISKHTKHKKINPEGL